MTFAIKSCQNEMLNLFMLFNKKGSRADVPLRPVHGLRLGQGQGQVRLGLGLGQVRVRLGLSPLSPSGDITGAVAYWQEHWNVRIEVTEARAAGSLGQRMQWNTVYCCGVYRDAHGGNSTGLPVRGRAALGAVDFLPDALTDRVQQPAENYGRRRHVLIMVFIRFDCVRSK